MTLPLAATIDAVFVGSPKTLSDDRGLWHTSIQRERTPGAVHITPQGILGDKATQPYHGSPDAALCLHLADHYSFWRQRHGVDLPPGAVGENLTLRDLTESQVFVGDIVRLGTALAQVSGPRVPCANLARHIGRPDWVRLTIRENRTGFYMRVLEPGITQAGDPWRLQDRLNHDASIPAINHCMYLDFDPAYAERILRMSAIGDWWRQQARKNSRPATHTGPPP